MSTHNQIIQQKKQNSGIIGLAIERPVAIISVMLMIVMFGIVALSSIPIQLIPDVNRPVITVRTQWAGAAPAEIEREIINKQEDVLKDVPAMRAINSTSEQGRGSVTLEFEPGTNMARALLLVANRLDRVNAYPEEANEPSLSTSGSEDSPIAWFIITRDKDNRQPIHKFGDFIEDVVKAQLERVPGVAEITVYGGAEREMQIIIDPQKLAFYGLTIEEVIKRLRQANTTLTAGDVDEGKRRYVVRAQGELNTPKAVQDVVLRTNRNLNNGRIGRVQVSDIAQVQFDYKEPVAHIRMMATPAIAFNARRETGANVIETMQGIKKAVRELNDGPIPRNKLKLRQVYDETIYINSAIDLVQQNIWVGGSLAILILLLFLRSLRATIIISVAIPVSMVGAFVAMALLGRTLNVISLAGLAFAVGMVVDAAIVVLENIYRLREQGMKPKQAAFEGARQVWGAILVSALTTVLVFIPILTMELEMGQLFRDIAVAISVAVMLSLFVSITVLPALASRLLNFRKQENLTKPKKIIIIDHIAHGFVQLVIVYIRTVLKNRLSALFVVMLICISAASASWAFLPKLEYLPEGNRNLLFGIMLPPPGYNLNTTVSIAKQIEKAVQPLWNTQENQIQDNNTNKEIPENAPKIERFFFVAVRNSTFLGAVAANPKRIKEIIPYLQGPMFAEAGTFGQVRQPSLFGRGFSGGRSIELDISGPDLQTILSIAANAFGRVAQLFPLNQGHQWRPVPGLELGAPEIRIIPKRQRLADVNMNHTALSTAIDAFNDGVRITEITDGSKRLDLTLKGKGGKIQNTQDISNLPIVTPLGDVTPVSSLAHIELTAGPLEIRHKEQERTVTILIFPSETLSLEAAVEKIQENVVTPMEKNGLPQGVKMTIAGTADKLTESWEVMRLNLFIALIIVYLVMAILFNSFIYPTIIMLSVPLATAGGLGGLAILNLFVVQQLDMLTMLGFIILLGIVVNNAILFIHQALLHIREEKRPIEEAIMEAGKNRIRPIFMSTITSVFGMLPLVLIPGAGSELYRGLGSVIIGGLSFSAFLTLFIIPPMLALIVGPVEKRRQKRDT